MPNKSIVIHTKCDTGSEQHARVNPGDMVRWKADHDELYVLKIPPNFFVGHLNEFWIPVFGQTWTDYYQVADNLGAAAINYIYSLLLNCTTIVTADGPPDIIIGTTINPGKK